MLSQPSRHGFSVAHRLVVEGAFVQHQTFAFMQTEVNAERHCLPVKPWGVGARRGRFNRMSHGVAQIEQSAHAFLQRILRANVEFDLGRGEEQLSPSFGFGVALGQREPKLRPPLRTESLSGAHLPT